MTDKQKEDLSHVVMATIQLNSVIHTLDKIEGTNEFKRTKKMEYNNFLEYVQKFLRRNEIELYDLSTTFEQMNQTQNYVECVDAFDKLAESITVIM